MPVDTIQWIDGKIRIIDQTLLPDKLIFLDIDEITVLEDAIRRLRVRGAPAIGIAGAMGAALAASNYSGSDSQKLVETVREAISKLKKTRPTAVNLFWALERMDGILNKIENSSVKTIQQQLLDEALIIWEEDKKICRQLGQHGAKLLPNSCTVLTHCNAGGLATADYGTALGVLYAAVEMGKKVKVYADETRPLLQGSRLTAWELIHSSIDVTVLCDSAAGFLMQNRKIDCVLVGADRIAANGDTANKVGTYSLSVLAKFHQIPFYIAAPLSTFDFSIKSGAAIPIEERSDKEVVEGFKVRTGPDGVQVYNPAFDITHRELISAFITERGILYPPFDESIQNVK